jgi:hypothetical protein
MQVREPVDKQGGGGGNPEPAPVGDGAPNGRPVEVREPSPAQERAMRRLARRPMVMQLGQSPVQWYGLAQVVGVGAVAAGLPNELRLNALDFVLDVAEALCELEPEVGLALLEGMPIPDDDRDEWTAKLELLRAALKGDVASANGRAH